MKYRTKWFVLVFLGMVAILIKLFSMDGDRVENYYSAGIYPVISKILRFSFGWIPFSLGDIIYGIAVIWLLWTLVKFMKAVFQKQMNTERLQLVFYKLLVLSLILYSAFNIFWGINYNRKGIASQLGLSVEKYSVPELKMIDSILLQRVNESKIRLSKKTTDISHKEIYRGVLDAYAALNKRYSFLNYETPSVKKSLWGWVGNYLGFIGYYNPLTGEANVNTSVPIFLQPYTTCHEMAHQLGYAKEDEANFVGYLAASGSRSSWFNYSVYVDLFTYANRTLYRVDSVTAIQNKAKLLPEVKADLQQWKTFMEQHRNPVEPIIRWMYGKFLQSNDQPAGVFSYDEVTGLLIAYYKKYGRI
ncbi:DUF3810 domain-containing protein [Ferruginibacter sp. SUN002]|uniref:DUF3810 domain-containing protein n=1 Tax=Ferruginibacter sp. SUN002 TaxID=2937789 RepID=UPI003D36C749